MATFNGARFLNAQLTSLLAQDPQPFELFVCDDGSTDTTLDILDRFAEIAPFRVAVRRNVRRMGYRANFMVCAALCTGELISFCDQDDVWEPNKLARVAACFEDPAVTLVAHGALLINAEDAVIGTLPAAPPTLFGEDPWALVYGFAETFRAELLKHSGAWVESKSHFVQGERMGHDRWILFVAAATGRVIILPDRLVRYRQHSANVYGAARKGALPRPPLLVQIRFSRESSRLAMQHRAAENHVIFLTKLAADPRSKRGAALPAMLASYRGLQRRLRLRRQLHASRGSVARLLTFARLISGGSYCNHDRWRFSLKMLVKDVAMLLPLKLRTVDRPLPAHAAPSLETTRKIAELLVQGKRSA